MASQDQEHELQKIMTTTIDWTSFFQIGIAIGIGFSVGIGIVALTIYGMNKTVEFLKW